MLPLDLKKTLGWQQQEASLFHADLLSEQEATYVFPKCARCLPVVESGPAIAVTSSDLLRCSLETII